MWKYVAMGVMVLACATSLPPGKRAPAGHGAAPKALAPLWVGPAFSGTWFNPERSGEGWVLEVLDDGSALLLWFTYPPAGSPAQQAWIIAQEGRIEGDRIRFANASTTRGPRFGAGFDPARLEFIPWGTIEFRFTSCNAGEVTYAGPPAWGAATRSITRLTEHAELECAGKRKVTGQGARSIDGLRQRSALWFDPLHNGEGWVVEELPDGRALAFWFTYDENGEQAWTIGTSAASGARLDVSDNARPVGTRFGADFNAAQVNREPWGRVEFDFENCDRGTLRYTSTKAAFGSGTLRPVRLTRLAGTACLDAAPAVPVNGTWSARAAMPRAQSEMAGISLGGMSYLAGGFGDPQGFKRYDPASGAWTILADVPGGRDHAVGLAVDGDIYVTGGYAQGGGDQQAPGWRYVVAHDRWETISELPLAFASGGAVVGGAAYFATVTGAVYQFNPRTRTSRVIASDGRAPRDHSQLVAFQGELWLIGGRLLGSSETSRVSIFDPASETWRPGPQLATSRAGFAAAASDTLLMVAGGELLSSTPWRVTPTVEGIAAGGNAWVSLPRLPTAVHGTVGAIHGNAFHVLAGSLVAGSVGNTGEAQVYRWEP